jgi:hypothetical protein
MGTKTAENINTVLSNEGGRCIELLHYADDPSVWIIRSSKKRLGLKTKTSTVWFVTKELALDYARKQTEGQGALQRSNVA